MVANMARQTSPPAFDQVHPVDENTRTDIDIIAIHGLDTKSPDTWIWKDPKHPKEQVNWLKDSKMLPSEVGRARIFTCDWPTNLFQKSIPTTLEESAHFLLRSIRQHLAQNKQAAANRPVFFIASCLGGIILIKALEIDRRHSDESGSPSLIRATRGIVFLATPFLGTAFKDMPDLTLKVWASLKDQTVTALIDYANEPTPNLDELLVDKSSATAQIFEHKRLNRCHVLMNKFRSPECDDYKQAAEEIKEILKKIREEQTPLEQADAFLRNDHYHEDKLQIERLSGQKLPMNKCYINLAIVEQPGEKALRSDTPHSSPFSLLARQKVETPDEMIQVELPTLFNQRDRRDGRMMQPRRILIRGRAGVGKTTLCKKMVYDFTHGMQTELHRVWTELFDRLLWVPLRNLKGRSAPGYNHEELFYHEYFSSQGHENGRLFARELWQKLKDTHSSRTLFVLDGLDELIQDLHSDGDMFRFLEVLLNQPNVIITSRPNASLPNGIGHIDLELETIGFYPDQVKSYLEADYKIKPRANEVQSFLNDHWLIQGLVRIPIQLDALCYTWEDFDVGTKPDTMTHIFQAIERRLWKKDVVRLGKMFEGHARSARPAEIERSVKTEIALLEYLAFNGLYSNVIDFTPAHRDEIVDKFPLSGLPLDEALARLSFLRTSDASSNVEDRNYHFIHLTFQEYFAAQYFVQQWTSGEQLLVLKLGNRQERSSIRNIDANNFIRKQKYNAHYDIFWRFVAGLINANHGEEQLYRFFRMIEDEPRDLLGPVHQRLVMHCLSEVAPSEDIPEFIKQLEENLKQWLMFEYTFRNCSQLAQGVEFPDQILEAVLREEPNDRLSLSKGLKREVIGMFGEDHKTLPEGILDALMILLRDPDSNLRCLASAALIQRSSGALSDQSALSEPTLDTIMAVLKDPEPNVRCAAADALRRHLALPEPVLEVLMPLLKDPNGEVRSAAVGALGQQRVLSEPTLEALMPLLKDPYEEVRSAAVCVLGRQSALPKPVLMALLKDPDQYVWSPAVSALGQQLVLSESALEFLVPLLSDTRPDVRAAAADALGQQSALSEPALDALVALLKDLYPCVRSAAVRALGGQSALSKPILEALIALLKDLSGFVRFDVASVLKRDLVLSGPLLETLKALSEDLSESVRSEAVRALSRHSALSEPALLSLLTDPDLTVRSIASDALSQQSALSEPTLEALTPLLQDPNKEIKLYAVGVLTRKSALSKPALEALAALFKDPDQDL
ncbi:hypothetical protein G7Z17_g4776 [Cylindrodendrum hubeiense]|uniref:NACHT domain-containing protein n=1 Tax=Cylindrodendrum hubeiense TaxID=595255 RepID=A0A9P5H874_9HYPO|nr:hypothetical protein G7Z17_g4776 [Cylindrodendrum hubeiense]